MGIYFASICGIIGKGKAVWITDRRGQLKRDGTRAETRFRLSAKRTNPFKSAGASVQSTTGTAEVCASVEVMLDTPCSEVVWRVLATTAFASFLFTSPSVRHRVASHFNWSLTNSSLVKISKRRTTTEIIIIIIIIIIKYCSVKLEAWAVGISAGSREVPGRNVCDRRH